MKFHDGGQFRRRGLLSLPQPVTDPGLGVVELFDDGCRECVADIGKCARGDTEFAPPLPLLFDLCAGGYGTARALQGCGDGKPKPSGGVYQTDGGGAWLPMYER